jgi:mannosyltransferase OCH1-like enzyme
MSIPKIIHQIWLQGTSYISDKSKKRIDKIKSIHEIYSGDYKIEYKGIRSHSTWMYRLWDEVQILQLLQTLDKKYIDKYYKFIHLHQKVDYAKFIILKVYGGIYIDIDCNVIKNLDGLFEHVKDYDFIVSYLLSTDKIINYFTCDYTSRCINNGIIISKKNTDICNYIIDELKYECNNSNNIITCIQNTTGPVIFNKIIYTYVNNNNNKSKVLILPPEFLEPCFFDKCINNENTYIEHIHERSWLSGNIVNLLYVYNKYSIIIYTICIIIIASLIIYIMQY